MRKKINLVVVGLLGIIITLVLNFYLTESQPIENKLSKLRLTDGFKIEKFADLSKLGKPRMMALDGHGNLILTLSSGYLIKLDKNANVNILAKGLHHPNGVEVFDDSIFVGVSDGILKFSYDGKNIKDVRPFISGLATGGHGRKSVKRSPDGFIYVNVGSSCNVCNESDSTRASILRFTLDGQPAGIDIDQKSNVKKAVWATGLRNSQGFAWHPVTKEFYATNEGADNRSESQGGRVNDDLPPEHLNIISGGGNYGWPYCWADTTQKNKMNQDPNFVGRPNICKKANSPAITLPAHSTPIGITFLNKSNFPKSYKEDAVIALHGSWNRKNPSGYQVVRVKFANNKPIAVEPFVTGWLQDGKAWGRPVDVIVDDEGNLLVSDDKSGLIYKISAS
ncbi:MAG TPA: PQQ-dependent sugar dehydrogenase [Methylophilus sp.]|nr:PQQ-dependent sugar dehydrogenase [Methylophilus sp.]HQQ33992.1 PQQ-dependent sugar dehydrogenase [Methylophilus sp.]